MYSALSPIMGLATGGQMLNFGYWSDETRDPESAQRDMCRMFADLAELDSARVLADVGSGLGAPAALWTGEYKGLSAFCVNTNYSQALVSEPRDRVQHVCSSATGIPLSDGAVDRVLALESAQHFRPFGQFVSESRRILASSGLLALAVPVLAGSASGLGILAYTWSSEHYTIGQIRAMLDRGGFEILREEMIGRSVYAPLADYYIRERSRLRALILGHYPGYVESVLYRSIKKMKAASEEGIIDYALIKCRPKALG